MKRIHWAGWWLASLLLVAVAMGTTQATAPSDTPRSLIFDPSPGFITCDQDDTEYQTGTFRIVTAEAAGDVKLGAVDGTSDTITVAAGQVIIGRFNRVYDTGTTLTDAQLSLQR